MYWFEARKLAKAGTAVCRIGWQDRTKGLLYRGAVAVMQRRLGSDTQISSSLVLPWPLIRTLGTIKLPAAASSVTISAFVPSGHPALANGATLRLFSAAGALAGNFTASAWVIPSDTGEAFDIGGVTLTRVGADGLPAGKVMLGTFVATSSAITQFPVDSQSLEPGRVRLNARVGAATIGMDWLYLGGKMFGLVDPATAHAGQTVSSLSIPAGGAMIERTVLNVEFGSAEFFADDWVVFPYVEPSTPPVTPNPPSTPPTPPLPPTKPEPKPPLQKNPFPQGGSGKGGGKGGGGGGGGGNDSQGSSGGGGSTNEDEDTGQGGGGGGGGGDGGSGDDVPDGGGDDGDNDGEEDNLPEISFTISDLTYGGSDCITPTPYDQAGASLILEVQLSGGTGKYKGVYQGKITQGGSTVGMLPQMGGDGGVGNIKLGVTGIPGESVFTYEAICRMPYDDGSTVTATATYALPPWCYQPT